MNLVNFLVIQSTYPLRPIMPNNASHSGITAAAGTCICHDFFLCLTSKCSHTFRFYNLSLLHLRQIDRSCFRTLPNILHCCRRAGLFPYPVWLILLSNQLEIVSSMSWIPNPLRTGLIYIYTKSKILLNSLQRFAFYIITDYVYTHLDASSKILFNINTNSTP